MTTQEYTPSSPASVGSMSKLLLGRKVILEVGMRTATSLRHPMEADTLEVMLQLKSAGLPLATTVSCGGETNATHKHTHTHMKIASYERRRE